VTVRVPKLTGLKIGDAKKLAEQTGYVLQEESRMQTPDWPEGVVFQQDPQPDALLKKTSVVRVRVSNGPPPFKLPQLTNTDPETARSTLETAGLKVELVREGSLNIPKGVVTRSEPPGDASVRPGDTIKVFVSMGPTVSAPDLKGMTTDLAQQTLAANGLTAGAITEVHRADVGDDIDSVPPGTVYSQDPPKGAPVEKGGAVNIRIARP
jgi:serine/threonine-protein kinase